MSKTCNLNTQKMCVGGKKAHIKRKMSKNLSGRYQKKPHKWLINLTSNENAN